MCSPLDAEERDHRSPRMLRCEILDSLGRSHSCVLKNISRRGLGGSGGPMLAPGQSVTVILPELATLTGCVRWVCGNKFGIFLDCDVDPELVRFVAPRNDAAPKFVVSALHQPVTDYRRPGF